MSKIVLYGGLSPYPWQTDSHAAITRYLDDPKRGQQIFVVKAARQRYGKSTFCKAELIRFSFHRPQSISAYISPTGKLARKMYEEIVRAAGELIVKKNQVNLTIEFENGSVIQFFSGEMRDALRGFTVTGVLILDECSYLRDDTYYELVAPWTTVAKAPTIMVSTPYYKTGFFYAMYRSGLSGDDPNYVSFDWTQQYTVPLDDFTLSLKDKMPLQKWQTEYLGYFIDAMGMVFGNFSACLLSEPPQADASEELYFGLDFGTGSGKDYTVLTALNERSDQVLIWRTNDKGPTEQVEELLTLLEKYAEKTRAILAEENGIGKVFLDMLSARGLRVKTFRTTNTSKRQLVDQLRVAFEQCQIGILNDPQQLMELSIYESTLNPNTNVVTFNAPSGCHDDMVMALMLSLEAQKRHNRLKYNISFI